MHPRSYLLRASGASVIAVTLVAMATAASATQKRLPEEYESASGHSLALDNAGSAALTDLSAVRINPAMLAMSRDYSLSGGYHWPAAGREFYDAGIVDGRTSSVVAGAFYRGFGDDYGSIYEEGRTEGNWSVDQESPVIRRAYVGLGQSFKKLAMGINGQYVEGYDLSDPLREAKKNGITFGLGIAGFVTPQLRFALSGENIANRKVADYAPRTFRGGLAYLIGGQFSVNLDYRHRDRVAYFEGPETPLASGFFATDSEDVSEGFTGPEQMVIGSFAIQAYDVLRFLGAYGQALSDERRTLSGGVALANGKFSLAYGANRPDLSQPEAHQAVSLSVHVSL